MIEITKENIGSADSVDKYFQKKQEYISFKRLFKDNQILIYLCITFLILAITNFMLIYSFFKTLIKL